MGMENALFWNEIRLNLDIFPRPHPPNLIPVCRPEQSPEVIKYLLFIKHPPIKVPFHESQYRLLTFKGDFRAVAIDEKKCNKYSMNYFSNFCYLLLVRFLGA